MKQTLSILIIAALLSSCGNSAGDKALSEAKQVESAIKALKPGEIATTAGGWAMTAKIAGKNWSANSMMSLTTGRIVGDNDGESISLPYDRREMKVGYKNKISRNNAVDLFLHDEVAMWGGYAGEMEITKVDADWAEGKFYFTGSGNSANQTIEVTEGFFRISMAPEK